MGTLSPTLSVRNMKETIEFYKNAIGFQMGLSLPDRKEPSVKDASLEWGRLSLREVGYGYV